MSGRMLLLVVLLIAPVMVLAGCASPTAPTPSVSPSPLLSASPAVSAGITSQPAPVTGASVSIKNFAFSPDTVAIAVHGNVTWINDDGFTHTVTFTGEPAQSVGSGASYTREFDAPGTYNYVCSIHPSMKGQVIVR